MKAPGKTLDATLTIEKDRLAVQQSITVILNIIRDYIPEANIREASDKLFDAFFINGVELTTNQMRKEYEQWKKLELDALLCQANPIFKVQP